MILFRSERENSLRLFCSIVLLVSIIHINARQMTYSVRHGAYKGSSHISVDERNDTVLVNYDTSVNWGIVKIKNQCSFTKKPLKPSYIETEFHALFKNYTGGTLFNDSSAVYYQQGDTIYNRGKYQLNDWLILPFFMAYVNDTIYKCSLLQGDYILTRSMSNDTVYWHSNSDNMYIVIYDSIPVRFINSNSKFIKQ